MRKSLLAIVLSIIVGQATAAPASAESIDKLLEVTRTEALFGSMYVGMEQMMRQSMQQATGGRQLTAEQQQVIDAMPARFMAIVREQFTWEKLRPQYVQLYRETFTQEEIDGLIAFYQSSTGQAFVNKMPVVMQKSVAIAQGQMQAFMPKMNAAIEQAMKEASLAK